MPNKLTRANAVFVKDDDGHDYCIHEDEEELFQIMAEDARAIDDWEEFEKKWGHFRTGMSPNNYRKEYLK